MGTESGYMPRAQAPGAQADLSPDASGQTATGPPPPALRAFADGFGGGFAGGLLYCLIAAWLYPDGLESAWWRVPVLALALGVFEMWRVARKRTPMAVR